MAPWLRLCSIALMYLGSASELFYQQKLRDLDIQVSTLAPKGDAFGASLLDDVPSRTLIVGEPIHDVINVRRAITRKANDSSDLIYR